MIPRSGFKEMGIQSRGIAVSAVQEQAGMPALQKLDVIKSSFLRRSLETNLPVL